MQYIAKTIQENLVLCLCLILPRKTKIPEIITTTI